MAAYNLVDFRHIYQTLTFSRPESSILLTTFFATLFLELEFAIYLGVLVSLVLFLARTSTPHIPSLTVDTEGPGSKRKFVSLTRKPLPQCPQLKIVRIDMSVYFGSINHIQQRIGQLFEKEHVKHILVVPSGINYIDLSGTQALVAENDRLRKTNGGLYFVGLKLSVYQFAVNPILSIKSGRKISLTQRPRQFERYMSALIETFVRLVRHEFSENADKIPISPGEILLEEFPIPAQPTKKGRLFLAKATFYLMTGRGERIS